MTIRALAGSGRSLNQVAEDSKGGTECRQSGASGPQAGQRKPDRERRVERAIGHEPTGGSVCQPAGSNPAGRPAAGNEQQDPRPTLPRLPARPPNDPAPPGAERARSSPRPPAQPGLPARGSPAGLTVEVLGRLPPQGLQAHLGVGPLQDQPPAVQVGAVAQGVEGSLWGQTRCVSSDLSSAPPSCPPEACWDHARQGRFWPW